MEVLKLPPNFHFQRICFELHKVSIKKIIVIINKGRKKKKEKEAAKPTTNKLIEQR